MKSIPLTQGRFAKVDDDDFERISKHKWCVSKNKHHRTEYAMRREYGRNRRSIKMHREILNAPNVVQVDHINGDGLDNRKNNLRFCNNAQNHCNKDPQRGGTSKYKGVSWEKRRGIWEAYICPSGKKIHLGYFHNEIDAAKAYDKKAIELYQNFAKPNLKYDY
jgi:hypothetical protein